MKQKGKPVTVIAEVGVNHNGNFQSALRYIKAAKDAGADAVKFQLFTAEKLVTKDTKTANYQKMHTGNKKQFDLLKKLEISHKKMGLLQDYASKIDIDFICTPFDVDALNFLMQRKISAIKFSSGDFDNLFMHEQIIKKKYPVILSSGMADENEIREVIKLYQLNNHLKVSLLHCVSAYPANIELLNLNYISRLSTIYPKISIGFSDHSTELVSGALSVMSGATIIEKHITFSRNLPGPDHKASLTISDFKKYIINIRLAEIALGSGIKSISKQELEIKKIARKSLAYSRDLKKGSLISKKDLTSLRPNSGISILKYAEVIDKELKIDVLKNTMVNYSDFKNL
jgi:sialic acid synthase SpsE